MGTPGRAVWPQFRVARQAPWFGREPNHVRPRLSAVNTRSVIAVAALGLSLAACSAIGTRPSASPEPTSSADPSPSLAKTATPTTTPGPTDSPRPSASTDAGVDGRQFVSVLVTENGSSKALVPGTKIWLGFSDGMISASSGCNSMTGQYSLQNGTVVAGEMAITEMGCPGNLMTQQQWLAAFLGSKPSYSLDGNDLVLTSDATQITFQDRDQAEPDQPLTGITWGLTTILDGVVAASIPAGVTATLLFHDNGSFDFNDGCNSGGGQYTVDGGHLHFSMVVSTQMACGGDKDEVASAVIAVLNTDTVDYSIDHTTLSLQAGSHGLQYDAAIDVSN
jgi:heat shock protein HslJ